MPCFYRKIAKIVLDWGVLPQDSIAFSGFAISVQHQDPIASGG